MDPFSDTIKSSQCNNCVLIRFLLFRKRKHFAIKIHQKDKNITTVECHLINRADTYKMIHSLKMIHSQILDHLKLTKMIITF